MSGIGAGLGIINKIFSRFNWDRKSIRRNKIKKIERQIDAILKEDADDKSARRLAALRRKLRALKDSAVSD